MAKVIVCSHRGPVTYQWIRGELTQRPSGPGGLVPTLASALGRHDAEWFFAAISDADREAAAGIPPRSTTSLAALHMIAPPPHIHDQHYRVISAGYLGMLFHRLFNIGYDPRFDRDFTNAWHGYQAVNRIFAEALEPHFDADHVLVHDYHLMTIPEHFQGQRRRAKLFYFHHVPWCDPEYFDLLPRRVASDILRGMTGFDTVGFHSKRWAEAFVRCCEEFLPDCKVENSRILSGDREVRVIVSPAALDSTEVLQMATSSETSSWKQFFNVMKDGRRAVVRVDRADIWKNIVRGFLAFEEFLVQRPELVHETCLLSILTPTRMWVSEYRQYLADCIATADAVNQRMMKAAGRPVILLHTKPDSNSSDRHRALGALLVADTLIVNSVADGLNLVAKEGLLVGELDPPLILSRRAGVYEELEAGVIPVNPFDISETAAAIEEALDMPPAERRRRAELLRALILGRQPQDWLEEHLAAGVGRPGG